MLFSFACEAMGAMGTRHSLRPLIPEGNVQFIARALSAPRRSEAVSRRRQCEERLRRSNPWLLVCGVMDCFASLAMTASGPSWLFEIRIGNRARSGSPHSLRGFVRLCAKHPRRRRKTARCAVGDLDLVLPWQAERPGHHVLHEGVRAIH